MITEQNELKPKGPKRGRLLSDVALINSSRSSKFWKNLFFKPKEALWMLLIQVIQSHVSLLAYGRNSVLKTMHGALSGGGIVQGIAILSWGIAYNSDMVWKLFSSFTGWFILPVYVWLQTPAELFDLVWVSIESKAMAIYLLLLTISIILNVGRSWTGNSNKSSVTSRGVSYSYLIVKRLTGPRYSVPEFVINLMETLIIIGIGVYLFIMDIDPYFGFWLVAISFSEMQLLLAEKSAKIEQRRLLDV